MADLSCEEAIACERKMRVMPVSLRDVAEKAGVARGTVSYVLNDRGNEARIALATQEKIRRIAREMGYQPNRLAQSLGKRHSNIIGLMIPGLRNPFFLDVIEMAESCALKAGYDVLPDSAFLMRSAINAQVKLAGWPVDGVLIWTRPEHVISEYLGNWSDGAPVVYLGHQRFDGADYVAVNRKMEVRSLMQHLRERGYRKISYISPWEGLQPEDVRYSIYVEICHEWGLEPNRIQLEPIHSEDNLNLITQAGLREAALELGMKIAARPKDEHPEAVFCYNDVVAIGMFHGLRRGGISVPDEIAVAGFDGIEEGLMLDKPLTTMVAPTKKIIEQAIEILSYRLGRPTEKMTLTNPRIEKPCGVILDSVLRVGATT